MYKSQENALFFYTLHLFRFSSKKTHATFHFNQNLFIHLRLFLIQKLLLRDHTNKTAFICQNNKKVSFLALSHIYMSITYLPVLQYLQHLITKAQELHIFFNPAHRKIVYASEHMKFVCSVNIYTSNTVIPSIFGFLFILLGREINKLPWP